MAKGFRYVPLGDLGTGRHVMVDGAPRPGTVLTLSHWPSTPTPPALRRDLSAESVLAFLDHRELRPPRVAVATVDHYDEDAVVGLALLCVPDLAERDGDLLVDVARAGDFGVVRNRRAALVSFALASLADAGRSPLPELRPPRRPAPMIDVCALAAAEALRALPVLIRADVRDFEALWSQEAAAYDASVAAFEDGWATLEERPDLDLAVVRIDEGHPDAAAARWEDRPLHRAAVHSATTCMRVATLSASCVEVRYRYETWVRLADGSAVRPRVDLAGVADELTGLEPDAARWIFDGANAITGALHPGVGSTPSVDPERFLAVVARRLSALDGGPPAWDPYR